MKGFKSVGFSAVGTAEQLKEYTAITKKKKLSGTIFHASPEGVSLRDEANKRTVGIQLKALLE